MPKASKESSTEVKDFGVAVDRAGDLDGYTVNFVSIREDHDLAPMLSGLPGGRCQCPHWGYVVRGEFRVNYADHSEVIRAGDAYYLRPGHLTVLTDGTEVVEFSPTKQLQETMAVVGANLEKFGAPA